MKRFYAYDNDIKDTPYTDRWKAVYLASEVDELLSKRTADAAAMLVDKQARIAELEKALRFIIENDLVMRSGLGWRDSGCGCCSGPVDVPPDIDSTVKSLMVSEADGR